MMTFIPHHLNGFPPPKLDWRQLIPLLSPLIAKQAQAALYYQAPYPRHHLLIHP